MIVRYELRELPEGSGTAGERLFESYCRCIGCEIAFKEDDMVFNEVESSLMCEPCYGKYMSEVEEE